MIRISRVLLLLFSGIATACGGGGSDRGTPCELLAGDIAVSEFMAAPTGDGVEWIELYNTTAKSQSLGGLTLRITGGGEPSDHRIATAQSLGATSYFVAGGRDSGAAGFVDVEAGFQLRNSGGIIEVVCGSVVVDSVGYGDQGSIPTGSGGASLAFDGGQAPDGLLNDQASAWCSGDRSYDEFGNLGSPGEANVVCGFGTCIDSGGGTREVLSAQGGDLVITEVLANPEGPDEGKEWIEVYVAAASAIDLNGLSIVQRQPDGGVRQAQVQAPECASANPGTYHLIGVEPSQALNGGVTLSVVASNLDLYNSAITLEIAYGEVIIDTASLPSPASGVSSALDTASLSPVDNDHSGAFCRSTTTDVFEGVGTPGAPNDACESSLPEGQCLDGDVARSIVDPAPGDLVITELLADPEGADGEQEWFEVYVAGSGGFDLNGLTLEQETESGSTRVAGVTSSDCVTVTTGSYYVIGASDELAVNGGVLVDAVASGLELYNSPVALSLLAGATLIDAAATPVPVAGVSASLDSGMLTSSDNDDAANFCASSSTGIYDGVGTPGVENDVCSGPSVAEGQCLDGDVARAIVSPTAGDLILTEVLANPDGPDGEEEYVEIYAENGDFDLNWLVIKSINSLDNSRGATVRVDDCISAVAGTYYVAASSGISSLTPDLSVTFDDGDWLYNSAQTLSLETQDGTAIDTANIGTPASGKPESLDPGMLSPSGNDEATHWCSVSTGTPGTANASCL